MIASMRRIVTTLLAAGALGLSAVMLGQVAGSCLVSAEFCAAAVSFSMPEMMLPDTALTAPNAASTAIESGAASLPSLTHQLFQVVSIYLIVFGVLAILALETVELHYLRALKFRRV